jgi:hypothetical protein
MVSCRPLILSTAALPPPSSNFHQASSPSSAALQAQHANNTIKTQTAKPDTLMTGKSPYQQQLQIFAFDKNNMNPPQTEGKFHPRHYS